MERLFLPVIAGTIRQQRKSIHAARLIHSILREEENVATVLVDPIDYDLPYDGNDAINKDPRYTELTARADGFFIVTPEYNHGYPATLKRMLDSELKNYIHKPVAFAGVSSGPWGGVRAIEALTNAVRELGLAATFTDVQFPNVGTLFDENGTLLDDSYIERVKKAIEELIWMAKALKWGRENVPSQYHS